MRHPYRAATTLPPHASSAAEARRFVERTLGGWRCHDEVDVARLLVSELVSNAVRHAGTPVRLTLSRDRGGIRVEVADGSHGAPRPRLAGGDAEAGRGLFLVDQLAGDWGVRQERRGKTVWFLLDPLRQIVRAG